MMRWVALALPQMVPQPAYQTPSRRWSESSMMAWRLVSSGSTTSRPLSVKGFSL